MPWCISITINEASKEEALKQLEKAVEDIKTLKHFYHRIGSTDSRCGTSIPYVEYESYEGI